MSRLSRLAVALLAAVFSLAALPALAAPSAWDVVEVTLHEERGGAVLLVTGTLHEGSKLPADVELAVPAGAETLWVGEILGGPVENDPSASFTTRTAEGMDVYSLRLTKALTGQVEVALPPVSHTADGAAPSISWTAPVAVGTLRLNALLPGNTRVTSPADDATMVPGPQGSAYYQRTVTDVKAGQAEKLEFTYTGGAPAAPPSFQPRSSGSIATPLFIVSAIISAGVLLLLLGRARRPAGPAEEHTGADEAEDAAPDHAMAAAAEPSEAEEAAPRPRRTGSRMVLALAAAVVGVAAVVAVANSGSPSATGDRITLQVAQVDTCTQTEIALSPPPGRDLADDAQRILNELRRIEGVGYGTVDVSTSRLEVAFCDSVTDEGRIRAALEGTGWVE